jgi:hypothetical protein
MRRFYKPSLWIPQHFLLTNPNLHHGLLGNSSTYNEYWIDYDYNSGTRRVRFRRSRQMVDQAVQDYNVALGTNDWHHIVLTYDGTDLPPSFAHEIIRQFPVPGLRVRAAQPVKRSRPQPPSSM